MRSDCRGRWILGLLLISGCAKPVAPVVETSGAASSSAVSGARVSAASHPFDVRLKIIGSLVTLDPNLLPIVERNQVFYVYPPASAASPLDTVPAYSELKQVQWRPADAAQATHGVDLDDPSGLVDPAPSAGGAAPDPAQTLAPGSHEFNLVAPDYAGGGTVTVRLFAGFTPSTWWAGPDPDRWPRSSDGDGRAVDVTDWSRFITVPAWPPDGRGYFGPDSFRTIPSQRRPVRDDFAKRTFYEIYGDRIYARFEDDTVHMNAWIVICNGGYDKDSPYVPKVVASDPGLPPGFAGSPDLYAVLLPQGLVGSPIGFRSQLNVKFANGQILRTAQSGLHPLFDPASVFRQPQVAGYWPALLPGKAYLVARAQDADGLLDDVPADPVGLADLVDAGGGTPAERLQRRQILTFHVRPAVP